jgi:hypothetical protein
VLKSATTKSKERKEPELSAKAVDCRVLLEGQVLSNRDQINKMTDRNCGLRHAQELLGKYCCIQTKMNCFVGVVSRECMLHKLIVIVAWSERGMSYESSTTDKVVRLDATKVVRSDANE